MFEELKLIVCPINKVGTTYWRNLHKQYHGKTLGKYKEKKRRQILKEYTKVIVVRHPLVRLRSAFQDRFAGMVPDYLKYYSPRIFRNENLDKHKKECMATDFKAFVQYIIRSKNDRNVNHHWKTFYSLCNPCTVNYDIIAKLETFNEDLNFIKGRIAANPPKKGVDTVVTSEDGVLIDACRPFETRLSKYPFLPPKCSTPSIIAPYKKRSLYLKGYLDKNDDLNLSSENKKVWYEQCLEKIKQVLASDGKSVISKRKRESIKKSFKELPRPVWNNMLDVLKFDMALFGYNPEDIFS